MGHSPQTSLLRWNGLQRGIPAPDIVVGQHRADCSHNFSASNDPITTFSHDRGRFSDLSFGHCGAVWLDSEVCARGNHRVEGSSDRSSVHGSAVYAGKVPPRTLPWKSNSGLRFWSRRFAGGVGDLDLLLSSNLFLRCRIYACIRAGPGGVATAKFGSMSIREVQD